MSTAAIGVLNPAVSTFSKPRFAVVRGVPETFSNCLTMKKPQTSINLDIAKQQHSNYMAVLRGLVEEVVVLPPNDTYPDCPFIEDTAIVIGSKALITRPGAVSRRGEVSSVQTALQNLGLEVVLVDAPGTIDGGDVLFAEGMLFVGQSRRTNESGIQCLSRAFPDIPVFPIDVSEGLHLKSVLSCVGRNTLVAEENEHAKSMMKEIEKVAECLQCVYVCEGAANVVRIGETVIYPFTYGNPSFYNKFAKQLIPVDISEFHKADGGLTCLSLIIS